MAEVMSTSNLNLHVQKASTTTTTPSSVKNGSSHHDKVGTHVNGVGEAMTTSKKVQMEGQSSESEIEVVNLSKDDLQLFEHQASGHGTAEKGLLKHKLGYILKPLQGPPKGTREVNFYKKVFLTEASSEECYSKLREFVPKFHGVAHLQQSELDADESNRYLLLDDALRDFKKPCVVDLKLGPRTWSPGASEEKIKQENSKYKGTKFTVGICLTGMIYYDAGKNFEMKKASKEFVKELNPQTLKDTLKKFMNAGGESSSPMSSIMVEMVCAKLQKIKEIFETQKCFRLYGSSILVAYDAEVFNQASSFSKDHDQGDSKRVGMAQVPLRVFMIDFAHFHPGEYDSVDENYLFGLRNLLKIFCDIAENA